MSLDVYLETKREITVEMYGGNITHNLGAMAKEAGIYMHLWRPDELGITKAEELIKPLTDGLKLLKSNPEHYRRFDASNGWGKYENLVSFVEGYLEACKQYPDTTVKISR